MSQMNSLVFSWKKKEKKTGLGKNKTQMIKNRNGKHHSRNQWCTKQRNNREMNKNTPDIFLTYFQRL